MTNHKRESKGDDVSNAVIQTLIDLTDDDKGESFIPIHKQENVLIDLTEPVNISASRIVDLTVESTSLQSFPRLPVEMSLNQEKDQIVDLTENSAELPSRMQNALSLPSVMDLTDDSVDMGANKNCGIDMMERNDEEEKVADSVGFSDQGRSVKRLTAQLKELQNIISDLENSEVDFDDEDDSSYVILDDYKQKVCEIHKRITGETQKFDKEPIEFNGTAFPEFNKKLEEMLNANRMFPSPVDVLKGLECCNRDYSYQLTEEDCLEVGKNFIFYLIASICFHVFPLSVKDALSQIGQEFQKQRSIVLNETFSFYTKNMTDPAVSDHELQTKLENNKRMDRLMN